MKHAKRLSQAFSSRAVVCVYQRDNPCTRETRMHSRENRTCLTEDPIVSTLSLSRPTSICVFCFLFTHEPWSAVKLSLAADYAKPLTRDGCRSLCG